MSKTKAKVIERGCFKRKEHHRKQMLNINVYEPSRKMRERNLDSQEGQKIPPQREREKTYITGYRLVK
jgi:hypothetical protein